MNQMDSTTYDLQVREDAKTDWLKVVSQKVASLRFGSVQITVHDGQVTVVESVEKTRFSPDRKAPGKRT